MTKRRLILVAVCAALIVVVALRWPPLDAGVVSITRVEVNTDLMVVDYRMTRPFEIALGHGIRERSKRPDGFGVQVMGSNRLRMEKVAVIPSEYDVLRGGHRVRLRLSRGASLTVEGNGLEFQVLAWSAPDAKNAMLHPPGEGVKMGDGVGIDIVQIAESPEREEYLILYAGTDVSHWVE